MPKKSEQLWKFENKYLGCVYTTDLFLTPELDGSPLVEDYLHLTGEEQLAAYVESLKAWHPLYLDNNAVPVSWGVWSTWSIKGGVNIAEIAPFQSPPYDFSENFLTHYTWPYNPDNGQALDWFNLPVRFDRFPEFARALNWMPSPLQATCPLRSILRSHEGG